MKTCTGKLSAWLSLATVVSIGILFPQAALAVASPSITTQPVSQSLLAGTNATFSVVATGQATLFYQWSLNGTNLTDSAHISGSANSTLTVSNLVAGDAGNYQVVVSNSHGSVTSSNATLVVLFPAAITVQPTNQNALIGGTIVFYSGATGQSPVSYQWIKNGGVVINGGRISGADTPTLTISNVQMSDTGDYQFEASNTNGTATSAPASLLIVPLASWGINYFGEQNFPLMLTNVVAVATGDANSSYLNLMLKADGSVTGWGSVIGVSNYDVIVPAGLSNAVAIAAGYRHGLDLQRDGTVIGFGDDSSGQATPPADLHGVVAVDAGWDWSLALKNDGTVVAWGDNSFSEAMPPPGLSNVVAISAGGVHGLVLKNDGTISGWGFNSVGEASSPAGLSNVVAVSAGYYHNLALKSDGTVIGWGNNLHGEINMPVGLSNVIAIAASYSLSLALRNDGTVVAWGDNFYGQSTPPSGLSNVVSIAAGGEYGLALLQNPATQVPPSIWWQGQTNQTVPTGQTLLFSPSVSGSQPMSFQWIFNGSPMSGQTNSWLLLPSLQTNQAGSYQFTVNNNFGSVTSQIASVIESPGILGQPINQSSLAGGTVAFGVTAAGPGTLSYQWYFNGSPLADDGRVSGSSTANLTISNVQSNDVGSYELVVTNTNGSATSQAATFALLVPAAITAPPVSQSILMTSNAAFIVSVAGTAPLSYQWFFNGALLTDGGRVSGSDTTDLIISNVQANDGGLYQFVATNNYGAATSAVATLTILLPASISGQPSNQAALINSNASFTATVTGTSPLTYQWYFNGIPLTDDGRLSGCTTTNLTIANVQTNDAGAYQLVATNSYGMATSASATLTVLVPASITSQPTNLVALTGSNVAFTVTATGTAPLNYLWHSNGVALANGGRFSGVTTAILNISSALTNDSGLYEVIVTNNYGSVTSSVATLTVYAPVQIIGHPMSQAVLLGSNTSFTVTAGGTTPGYQWFFNGASISDNFRISGSGTATLNISNAQSSDAGGYSVIVSNIFSSATSRMASLTPQVILSPSVRYVDLNSTNPLSPYLSWNTAATNIQDAIDAAVAGDLVLVTNGIYQTGGRAVYAAITNRVVIDKPITVSSVNGPVATIIQGSYTPPTRGGPNTRCAYLTNDAVLSGFALTNGGTFYLQSQNPILVAGGGVFCENSSAVVSNCVIAGNTAAYVGGGAFGGTLIGCMIISNTASQGGGTYSNTLINCTLARNFSSFQNLNSGGGAYSCTLSNCLIVGNNCYGGGGGAFASALISCVVSNNSANYGGGLALGFASYSLISSNHANNQGGGVYSNITLNCIFKANLAGQGGAAAYSTLNKCLISANRASNVGGGAFYSTADNSIFTANTSGSSGCAAYYGTLLNCTVVSNRTPAGAQIYAVYGSGVTNSIVYDNAGGNIVNSKNVAYSCNIPTVPGPGNFTNPPLLVAEAGGDFHLQSSSPCINGGINSAETNSTDLDGNPRIVNGTTDIGAYEFQSPSSLLSYAWAQQYGLPMDGSADLADTDGDGLNNYAEWKSGTIPTNAASVLQMASPSSSASGVTVTWQSVSGVTYYLQRSITLPAFTSIASNLIGQAGTTSYIDTTATNTDSFFYRVGVQ